MPCYLTKAGGPTGALGHPAHDRGKRPLATPHAVAGVATELSQNICFPPQTLLSRVFHDTLVHTNLFVYMGYIHLNRAWSIIMPGVFGAKIGNHVRRVPANTRTLTFILFVVRFSFCQRAVGSRREETSIWRPGSGVLFCVLPSTTFLNFMVN